MIYFINIDGNVISKENCLKRHVNKLTSVYKGFALSHVNLHISVSSSSECLTVSIYVEDMMNPDNLPW